MRGISRVAELEKKSQNYFKSNCLFLNITQDEDGAGHMRRRTAAGTERIEQATLIRVFDWVVAG
jgi:hypothetical protein